MRLKALIAAILLVASIAYPYGHSYGQALGAPSVEFVSARFLSSQFVEVVVKNAGGTLSVRAVSVNAEAYRLVTAEDMRKTPEKWNVPSSERASWTWISPGEAFVYVHPILAGATANVTISLREPKPSAEQKIAIDFSDGSRVSATLRAPSGDLFWYAHLFSPDAGGSLLLFQEDGSNRTLPSRGITYLEMTELSDSVLCKIVGEERIGSAEVLLAGSESGRARITEMGRWEDYLFKLRAVLTRYNDYEPLEFISYYSEMPFHLRATPSEFTVQGIIIVLSQEGPLANRVITSRLMTDPSCCGLPPWWEFAVWKLSNTAPLQQLRNYVRSELGVSYNQLYSQLYNPSEQLIAHSVTVTPTSTPTPTAQPTASPTTQPTTSPTPTTAPTSTPTPTSTARPTVQPTTQPTAPQGAWWSATTRLWSIAAAIMVIVASVTLMVLASRRKRAARVRS